MWIRPAALVVSALVAATSLAHAQGRRGSALHGIGSAEATLQARGNVKGADRIARARCFSGLGPCKANHARQRERARARAQYHR